MKLSYRTFSMIFSCLLLVICSVTSIAAQEAKDPKRQPAPGDGRRRPAPDPAPPAFEQKPTRDAVATPVYELRCRGGNNAFQIEDAGLRRDDRRSQSSGSKTRIIFMKFNEAYRPAGTDGGGLTPGSCSWTNRVLSASEPKMIRFELASFSDLARTSQAGDSREAVDSFRKYLNDPNHYESFFVYQTDNGYFQATKHEHWTGRIDPSKVGVEERKNRPVVIKP